MNIVFSVMDIVFSVTNFLNMNIAIGFITK